MTEGFCKNCDGQGWVCENHADRPWDGVSNREDACGCGAGAPCECNPKGEHVGMTVIWSIWSNGETVQ